MFKIYNQKDFDRITKGIKVAQCMQSKSSAGKALHSIDNYIKVVSNDNPNQNIYLNKIVDAVQQ